MSRVFGRILPPAVLLALALTFPVLTFAQQDQPPLQQQDQQQDQTPDQQQGQLPGLLLAQSPDPLADQPDASAAGTNWPDANWLFTGSVNIIWANAIWGDINWADTNWADASQAVQATLLPPQVSSSGPNPPTSFRPATSDDKNRLAVNPVTGLAVSPASNYRPLTDHERWKLYWKQNYFSVGAYFGPVFSALVLDQATGSPSAWGGGFHGFGLRVASRTANAMLQGTVQAPLALVLHEDVRYISSDGHGFKHRAWHAIKYSFLTYNDQGRPTLNVANLTGYYVSTAITTAWLPERYAVIRYTFSNSSEQIALSVPVNLLQEFWPEVTRIILRRRLHPDPPQPQP